MKNFQKIKKDLIILSLSFEGSRINTDGRTFIELSLKDKFSIILKNNSENLFVQITKNNLVIRAIIEDMIICRTNIQCIYKQSEFFVSFYDVKTDLKSGD